MKDNRRPRLYWAVQGKRGMPCLFGPRAAAIGNLDDGERLVLCRVEVVREGRLSPAELRHQGSESNPFPEDIVE